MADGPEKARPRVVILGAGFAGLTAAKKLAGGPADVTLIDRQNYHLFQPLLYQVATATLSPADIAVPIRSILRGERNIEVLLDRVTEVNREERRVKLSSGKEVAYDWLIVATGARHAYFGHDEWEEAAPGLKEIDEATEIRRRILLAFERAEMETDPEKRKALMTFVVVGGGPTGVEMAGAIAELAKKALAADFRHIDPSGARIVLIEAGPRILTAFPEKLAEAARQGLERMGVDVELERPVTLCDRGGIDTEKGRIEARTIVWAAGVEASPAAEWLGVESDKAGRIPVGECLTLKEDDRIFIVGDIASVPWKDDMNVPGIAPAAKQMGTYVAKAIRTRISGGTPPPFRYRHNGNLATVGRKLAVIDFGWLHLKGRFAWFVWGFVHIFFLVGFRNRLFVVLRWLWAYFTFRRGVRLITGPVDIA